MKNETIDEKRKGSDQELAAIEATTNLVQQMVDFLFRQEHQWKPKVIEKFSDSMRTGNASMRVVFDLNSAGLAGLKIYGVQQGKADKLIFDIAPKHKLDS